MNRYNGNSDGNRSCSIGRSSDYGIPQVSRNCYVPSVVSERRSDSHPHHVNGSCGCPEEHNSQEGCGVYAGSKYGIDCRPVGSVYAPLQNFEGLYDLERALCRGTIFAALDLPLESACGNCGCDSTSGYDGRKNVYQNGGGRRG